MAGAASEVDEDKQTVTAKPNESLTAEKGAALGGRRRKHANDRINSVNYCPRKQAGCGGWGGA